MALHILAEAAARIEHKLDMVLKLLKALTNTPLTQLKFSDGVACPLCLSPISYTIDVTHNVVVRRCGCTTGRQASAIPLTPVVPGDPNGSADRQSEGAEAQNPRNRSPR